MDHPGALRHPTDREAGSLGDRGLRAGVGREDRLGRRGAAAGGERGRGLVDTRAKRAHRQPRADDAGREDDDLLGRKREQRGGVRGGRPRVVLAGSAGRRVRDARVDDDRLRLGELQVATGDDDRCCLDAVQRPHRSTDGRDERADERHVGLAGRAGSRRSRLRPRTPWPR